ncbi:MAG: hypothetical protein Q9225_002030 [Loekoesia sp. 1 TL-2023]
MQEFYQSTPPRRKTGRNIQGSPRPTNARNSICLPRSSVSRGISEDIKQPDKKESETPERKGPSSCPVASEFGKAQAHHPVLASTGCTKEFCQAGRAVHSDEPRIGENRAIEAVEQEAEGFLRELHREHFYDTDEAFTERLNVALAEIRAGACEGTIREGHRQGTIGGNWSQTTAELEFGIRRAWRNARKSLIEEN